MKKSIIAISLNTSCAAAFAAALFACGTGNSAWAADPPPPANHAAALLTQDLAQKILGKPVDISSENQLPDAKSSPAWVSKGHYQVKSDQPCAPAATLIIRHGASKDEAKYNFTTNKNTCQGVDVTGLNTPAYRTKTPAQLHVLKGANWIIIAVGTVKAPDTSGQEKLAKEILPKVTD